MTDCRRSNHGSHALISSLAITMLLACRGEPERSAMAQVPGDGAVATAPTAWRPSGMPGVEVRRLWAGQYHDFYASSISPDGRYLSMVDLEGLLPRDVPAVSGGASAWR